jgi:chemotaxis protein MotB
MRRFVVFLFFGLSVFLFNNCVSMRQFKESQGKLTACDEENGRLKMAEADLTTRNTELKSEVDRLTERNKQLTEKVDVLTYDQKILKDNNSLLEKNNEGLSEQLNALKKGSSSEIEKLLTELNSSRNSLNSREDSLLIAKRELEQRNSRLIELENILKQKDEVVKDLRNKVANALKGFNNSGLTVYEKNGKVYVSLEEKLLFKTGQWVVDPRGQQALKELGVILAQNPDINIMVEGHTDDVTMRGSGDVKDNWDLSVMRSTAVTKILTQNKQIDPKRIISAGRSEFMPVDPEKTQEARQKNRRTEIILTPRIDELLKIIENN